MTLTKTLISIRDVSRTDIERLITAANGFRKQPGKRSKIAPFMLGILFFQSSTRTQIGFQTASYRLGGGTFVVTETKFEKRNYVAESLEDTVKVLQSYADILCIRHSDADVFSRILPFTARPVVNCGNGYDEHPTQTLIDLMTVRNLLGRLDNLKVAIVGDLLHMRTGHSLLLGLSKFRNVAVSCISPRTLRMPEEYKSLFKKSGQSLLETDKLDLANTDVVYMAGFAAKTPVGTFGTAIRKRYRLDDKASRQLKDKAIVLCALPRIDEIDTEIDESKFAKYFVQSEYGQFMRMAIIAELLK